ISSRSLRDLLVRWTAMRRSDPTVARQQSLRFDQIGQSVSIQNRQKCLGCITQSAAEHADALDPAIASAFKAFLFLAWCYCGPWQIANELISPWMNFLTRRTVPAHLM